MMSDPTVVHEVHMEMPAVLGGGGVEPAVSLSLSFGRRGFVAEAFRERLLSIPARAHLRRWRKLELLP